MNKILISYRREDSADVTGRIYDRLIQAFDRESVFKDVDSIPLGVDFRTYLDAQVAKCHVFLAVIGRDWMKTKGVKSKSGLEDPKDFVRIEIESALKREIPLIPVLVGGASIPAADRLPPSMQELAYRNGIAIRTDPDFHRDMDRLIDYLKKQIRLSQDHRAEQDAAVQNAGKEVEKSQSVSPQVEPPSTKGPSPQILPAGTQPPEERTEAVRTTNASLAAEQDRAVGLSARVIEGSTESDMVTGKESDSTDVEGKQVPSVMQVTEHEIPWRQVQLGSLILVLVLIIAIGVYQLWPGPTHLNQQQQVPIAQRVLGSEKAQEKPEQGEEKLTPDEITPKGGAAITQEAVGSQKIREKSERRTQKPAAREITGKDGAPMVLITAGEFGMGSTDGEGDKEEHPRHKVFLDAYYIDKFELTVSRYAEFMRSTGRRAPLYWDQVKLGKHDRLSVVGVDWHDADAYCRWAGKRLPTEAEWEKAARGTDGLIYPWGNDAPTSTVANFNKRFTTEKLYDQKLAPVESYEAGKSPYGLHHLAGNVWEWTSDWYDESYYAKSPERNPKGPSSGQDRVLRGGSWLTPPDFVRSPRRNGDLPTRRTGDIGFRCAGDGPG
jgi:formylglycine-generating enzyme required for sulfatase activity